MKNTLTVIALIICSNLLSQTNVYNDMYQQAYRMLQSGNINQGGLQKMYDDFSKEYDKQVENNNKNQADNLYNNGVDEANNYHHLAAIENFNTSISYYPTSKAYNYKGCSEYELGEYKNALESFKKALELDPNNDTYQKNKMLMEEMILKVESAPILIYNIKIANAKQDGTLISDYDSPIFSNNTYYLKPKIYYKSNLKSNLTLNIKYILSDGSLSTGKNSPEGYSTKSDMIINGNGSRELSGWGSVTKGNWSSGIYRVEVWYEGICLGSTNFSVLPESSNAIDNISMPSYPTTQINGNSGNLTLKQKVCNYCKGTGNDPYPSYGTSYGLDRSSDKKCEICGKYENHYHKRCISCSGKGYIESY